MAEHDWAKMLQLIDGRDLGWQCLSCRLVSPRPHQNDACLIKGKCEECETLKERCAQLETLCTDLRTRLLKLEREVKYGARP